jgi:peptide/nickel transport system permease protein
MDRPIYIQYLTYLQNLLKGNFGRSIFTARPVLYDLKEYFPATFELTVFSLFLATLFGILSGIVSANHKDKGVDHATRIFSLLGLSMPIFWLGLLLLLVIHYYFGLLFAGARLSAHLSPPTRISGLFTIDSLITGNWVVFKDSLLHLILPSICLAMSVVGRISRMTRSSILNVIHEDYVRTAKSKGLPHSIINRRYILRNALLPIITLIGVMFGRLLSGVVITEIIFSWPGLGRYAVEATMSHDFVPLMGFSFLIAFLYGIVNLIVDILYSVFDPRVELG